MGMAPSDMQQEFLSAYDSYADAIFRHIALRLGDREQGRDLMQETFLKAWEYVRNGKKVENLRAFLYKVANNLIIDVGRRRKLRREESLEALQEEGFDLPDEGNIDPGVRIDAKQAMKILRGLDEQSRTAVIMRYVDGLPPREIAELLGVSANVASVRINRGLEKLRSHYEEHD